MVGETGVRISNFARKERSTGNLASIIIVGIVGTLSQAASPLIVDGLVHAWGLTPSQAGYIASAETAGSCLGTLLVVLLSARITPRRLISVGMILLVIGNLLCVRQSGFSALIIFRSLAGLGCGLTMAFVSLLAQTERPQLNYALYMASLNIVVSAFSASVPILLTWRGVGGVYIAIGLITMGALTVVGGLPNRLAVLPAVIGHNDDSSRRFFKMEKGAAAALLLQMFAFGAVAMVWVYLGEFAARHSIADATLSVVVSISWICAGTTGALAAGFLEGRMRPQLSVMGACLSLIGIITVLWYSKNYSLAVSGIFLFVFAWSFLSPPVVSILATIDPTGRLATAGMLVQTIGFSAGPALAALILHYTGIGWVATASVAGFALSIITLRFIGQRAEHVSVKKMGAIISPA